MGLAGAALTVCAVLIIGLIYFSAQTSEAKSGNSPVTIKKLPQKSDTTTKIDLKTSNSNKGKQSNANQQNSEDDENRAASKNDSDEDSSDEAESSTESDLTDE